MWSYSSSNGACHLKTASISCLLSVEMTLLTDSDTDNENSETQQSKCQHSC